MPTIERLGEAFELYGDVLLALRDEAINHVSADEFATAVAGSS
jgi:hypothetical protein